MRNVLNSAVVQLSFSGALRYLVCRCKEMQISWIRHCGWSQQQEGRAKLWIEKDLLKPEVSCPRKGFWAELGEWRTGQVLSSKALTWCWWLGEVGAAEGLGWGWGGVVSILLNYISADFMASPKKRGFSQNPPCLPWVLGWRSLWKYHRSIFNLWFGVGVFAFSPSLLFVSAESHLT